MTDPRAHKAKWADLWTGVGTKFLPFADAASDTLPLGRLLRLSLFQISVGMALTLLTGTINRVMIVELGVFAWLVALMVSLPLVFAPLRALIGHKSDTHRSMLGWRRGPYIWFGSLLQFSGLAIMPFALLILSGDAVNGPVWVGQAGAALAFLLIGAGLHTTQTAGLALATDIAPEDSRPRVVALLYVMLLVGMGASALVFGVLLADFTQLKLIKVIQGAAVVTMALNMIALWKQEARDPALTDPQRNRPAFSDAWKKLISEPRAKRLLIAVGLGAAAFSMQDVLLEPYGGEILGLSVSDTTMLTAIFAGGTLAGFALAGRRLMHGGEPHRLAGLGALIGVFAFSAVIFAEPLGSATLFRIGTALIGFGGGLFSVCTLTSVMALAKLNDSGIALGAWGAVQATAAGGAIALGGALRDAVGTLAANGAFGPALGNPAIGYSVVYHIEILLLFAALAAIGPLARYAPAAIPPSEEKFGLAAFPG
ncbi:MAG: BCD family MFS transporter [Pseudomonadota bacterium]